MVNDMSEDSLMFAVMKESKGYLLVEEIPMLFFKIVTTEKDLICAIDNAFAQNVFNSFYYWDKNNEELEITQELWAWHSQQKVHEISINRDLYSEYKKNTKLWENFDYSETCQIHWLSSLYISITDLVIVFKKYNLCNSIKQLDKIVEKLKLNKFSKKTGRELQKHSTQKRNEKIVELYKKLKETEPNKNDRNLAQEMARRSSICENLSAGSIRKIINKDKQATVKTLWENHFCNGRHEHRIHELIARIKDHVASDIYANIEAQNHYLDEEIGQNKLLNQYIEYGELPIIEYQYQKLVEYIKSTCNSFGEKFITKRINEEIASILKNKIYEVINDPKLPLDDIFCKVENKNINIDIKLNIKMHHNIKNTLYYFFCLKKEVRKIKTLTLQDDYNINFSS